MRVWLLYAHTGTGHCLHDDDPPAVNSAILKWLEKHHAQAR